MNIGRLFLASLLLLSCTIVAWSSCATPTMYNLFHGNETHFNCFYGFWGPACHDDDLISQGGCDGPDANPKKCIVHTSLWTRTLWAPNTNDCKDGCHDAGTATDVTLVYGEASTEDCDNPVYPTTA
jgi:hypothetical protein